MSQPYPAPCHVLHCVPDIALPLSARPLEPASLTLRSRYQLPDDMLVVGRTLTIPDIPFRPRAPGCPIGAHPRALRDCNTRMFVALRPEPSTRARPREPAALALRSRFTVPADSLTGSSPLTKPNIFYRAKAKMIGLIRNVTRPFQTGSILYRLAATDALMSPIFCLLHKNHYTKGLQYPPLRSGPSYNGTYVTLWGWLLFLRISRLAA